jgi:anti-sigma B factor antagonist
MSLIDVKSEHGVSVVDLLAKRLDASMAVSFKESMHELIKSGKSRLVLNMNAVQFVDSSGLGALVSVLKALGPSQGTLSITNLQPGVVGLFKLTRMDKVFSIQPTVAEAVSANSA